MYVPLLDFRIPAVPFFSSCGLLQKFPFPLSRLEFRWRTVLTCELWTEVSWPRGGQSSECTDICLWTEWGIGAFGCPDSPGRICSLRIRRSSRFRFFSKNHQGRNSAVEKKNPILLTFVSHLFIRTGCYVKLKMYSIWQLLLIHWFKLLKSPSMASGRPCLAFPS